MIANVLNKSLLLEPPKGQREPGHLHCFGNIHNLKSKNSIIFIMAASNVNPSVILLIPISENGIMRPINERNT